MHSILSASSKALLFAMLPALACPAVAGQKPDPEKRATDLVAKMSLEQKIDLIGGQDRMYIRALPEVGFPRLKMTDGPFGISTWGPSYAYAAGIGMTASWDPELARKVGEAMGRDARANGVHFLLAPGVNIYRSPMNGRNFEYFGEDPYLAGRIAVGFIKGVQSQEVVATVKHFAANNSEYDRHRLNSVVDERTLREIYLPAFEAAVKEAKVGAVMDSYNLVNGVHSTQNAFLNLQVLKGDWGFKGILMSDWRSVYDGVAAAKNGLDLEMPSAWYMNRETLLPRVRDGSLATSVIDDKALRIVRTAAEFGFLDRDQTLPRSQADDERASRVALESAQKSIVLLKNDNDVLPFEPGKLRSIAVLGPSASPAIPAGGGTAEVAVAAPVSFLTGISLATDAKVYTSNGIRRLHDIFYTTQWATVADGAHLGLKLEEFGTSDFTGAKLESWVEHLNRWEGPASQPPGAKAPKNFKVSDRFTGYYIPRKSGEFLFITEGAKRDTYKLWINDVLVIDHGVSEGRVSRHVAMNLEAGKAVAVRLDYVTQTNRPSISLGVVASEDVVHPEAIRFAQRSDAAVVCVGFDIFSESEGYDRAVELPFGQEQLIKAVCAANPRTVVVLTGGGSVETSRWIAHTPALIHAFYGGQEAGSALAQVLLGEISPSGHLPFSFERELADNPSLKFYYPPTGSRDLRYDEGLFVGYRQFDRSSVKPLFSFGHGLSYTSFAYSNLEVQGDLASGEGVLRVSFDIRNTGRRTGAAVPQIYVGENVPKVERPVKELKGFARVELKPGESQRVSIALGPRAFAYWDTTVGTWKVQAGTHTIFVGDSSANILLKQNLVLKQTQQLGK